MAFTVRRAIDRIDFYLVIENVFTEYTKTRIWLTEVIKLVGRYAWMNMTAYGIYST